MASISPGEEDGDASEGDAGDEEDSADAGLGDEGVDEASNEVNEVEARPFYGGRGDDDEDAPLSLLSQGDTLPLSYRSDNGTRESEFFVGDEKEKVNPYYDVVRRLSPTELIGRFMRTSSPRVRGGMKGEGGWKEGRRAYISYTLRTWYLIFITELRLSTSLCVLVAAAAALVIACTWYSYEYMIKFVPEFRVLLLLLS